MEYDGREISQLLFQNLFFVMGGCTIGQECSWKNWCVELPFGWNRCGTRYSCNATEEHDMETS